MTPTCVCDTGSIDMSQYLAKNGTILKSLFVDNISNELPKTFDELKHKHRIFFGGSFFYIAYVVVHLR